MKQKTNEKGITLIALIITIIVMLILVTITVTIAMEGGIFTKAKEAAKQSQIKADEETLSSIVASAYDSITGEIKYADLKSALVDKKWSIDSQESDETWTCISPKENKFTVTKKGKITYVENTETRKDEEEKITPGATFNDDAYGNADGITGDVTLTWDELKLAANGTTYGYDASAISDIMIGPNAFCIDYLNFYASLISITIPDSVKTIGGNAFLRCIGLTSITIGNSVESIGDNAFGECTGIMSVSIGNSVERIGNNAFEGCDNLTSVTYKSTEYTSVSALTTALKNNGVTAGKLAFDACGIDDESYCCGCCNPDERCYCYEGCCDSCGVWYCSEHGYCDCEEPYCCGGCNPDEDCVCHEEYCDSCGNWYCSAHSCCGCGEPYCCGCCDPDEACDCCDDYCDICETDYCSTHSCCNCEE